MFFIGRGMADSIVGMQPLGRTTPPCFKGDTNSSMSYAYNVWVWHHRYLQKTNSYSTQSHRHSRRVCVLWTPLVLHELYLCKQARRKHFLSGTATGEGSVGSGDPSARSAEKLFFTFIFQLSGLALIAPLCFAVHCQGRT